MPLFFQQNINEHTAVGIWAIEEEESFFLESASVQRVITHPQKRKQHLAGRFMLTLLCPSFPLEDIQVAATRKPFLPEDPFHFSISHSGNYAAAIVSSLDRVGVDVELYTHRVMRIMHKFLSEEEAILLNEHHHEPYVLETLCWSVKESVFKWYGSGEVDFIKQIRIRSINKIENNRYELNVLFNDFPLMVIGQCFSDFCLTWVVTK